MAVCPFCGQNLTLDQLAEPQAETNFDVIKLKPGEMPELAPLPEKPLEKYGSRKTEPQPEPPPPERRRVLFWLLAWSVVLVLLAEGIYWGRQIYQNAPSPDQISEAINIHPVVAAIPAAPQLVPPPPFGSIAAPQAEARQHKMEAELKEAEKALRVLREQSLVQADYISALQEQLKEMQKSDRKKYHSACGTLSLLSSAYTKLLEGDEGDAGLNSACAQLQKLEKSYASNRAFDWQYAVKDAVTVYLRAERHVNEAEAYLVEKLNEISKIIGDPHHWVATDLWEPSGGGSPSAGSSKPTIFLVRCNCYIWTYQREKIVIAFQKIKSKVEGIKNLAAQKSLQQQIDAAQGELAELEARINTESQKAANMKQSLSPGNN
jgi:hypothetical protein